MQQNQPRQEPWDEEPAAIPKPDAGPPQPASTDGTGLAGASTAEGMRPADRAPTPGDTGLERQTAGAPVPRYDGTTANPMARSAPERRVTRAGMIWTSVIAALAVLVLLIVFILQNQDLVLVRFFGFEGVVSLGVALFIAAVGGGVLVAMAGAARIIQLRAAEHRRKAAAARGKH